MNLTQSIEIVQSFRNWTNDATLPMPHTKGEVIEALDVVLHEAKIKLDYEIMSQDPEWQAKIKEDEANIPF